MLTLTTGRLSGIFLPFSIWFLAFNQADINVVLIIYIAPQDLRFYIMDS